MKATLAERRHDLFEAWASCTRSSAASKHILLSALLVPGVEALEDSEPGSNTGGLLVPGVEALDDN